MLFFLTLLIDLSSMAITLWMASYLFVRGYKSGMTLRVVVALASLSVFFFSSYNNIFHQVVGSASLRSVELIISMGAWYSLTDQLANRYKQKGSNLPSLMLYLLGIIAIILLVFNQQAYIGEQENALYVTRMNIGLPFTLFSIYQIAACIGFLYNLLKGERIGITAEGRLFLLASFFPAAGIVYGVLGMAISDPVPRLYQDLLAFGGVFILGISVVRYQTLVERHTTYHDFPLTSLTVFLLTAISAILGLSIKIPLEMISWLVAFIVIILAIYDLVREQLELIRARKESDFRRQLRHLESNNPAGDILKAHLQEGLVLLCQTLNAGGGLIAIREGEEFVVVNSQNSLPVGEHLDAEVLSCEDVCRPDQIPSLSWIAPSFDGRRQIAVLGIGEPISRLNYSAGELDLLAETADQVGTVVTLSNLQSVQKDMIFQQRMEPYENINSIISAADGMVDQIRSNPDPEFIKLVEEALRNLPDTIALGISSLADSLQVTGESSIERGKNLSQLLTDSIDSLKPAEKRPREPLPRAWYNHAVLFDAYVEGVPNREIMSRLFISEGTFNRTRRNAIRGLARMLMEKRK